jgi:AcrR family transcriptional regulator
MSVDDVASAAGVGRTTIYRRYRDKPELVAAAVAAGGGASAVPDTGSTYEDLVALMRDAKARYETAAGMPMAGVLLVDGPHNPRLLSSYRERVIGPRRRRYHVVLERGQARGELRDDLDRDAAIDALTGSYYARHIAGLPITRNWARHVVDVLWPAICAEGGRHPRGGSRGSGKRAGARRAARVE